MIKLGFFGAFFSVATTFFVFGFTGATATGDFLTVAARVRGDSLQKIKKKKKKKNLGRNKNRGERKEKIKEKGKKEKKKRIITWLN